MNCTHTNTEARKQTKINGVVVVVLQCLDCGSRLKELPKAAHNLVQLKEFDDAFRKQKSDEYFDAQQAKLKAEKETMDDFWWQRYNEYLQSEHWQFIRRRVLDRDSVCQICFRNPCSQAHHVSYDSFNKIGYSFTVECVGLCSLCHDTIHDCGI